MHIETLLTDNSLCDRCLHHEGGRQHPKRDEPGFWALPAAKCFRDKRMKVKEEDMDA